MCLSIFPLFVTKNGVTRGSEIQNISPPENNLLKNTGTKLVQAAFNQTVDYFLEVK